MKCPKCKSTIKESETVCPKCHKVLLLECPNCHSIGDSSVCKDCGHIILIKCAKCQKIVPTHLDACKCGFRTATSIAIQECESDEFASIIIEYKSLNAIKNTLNSEELFTKFYNKLKNILLGQLKNYDCKVITYDQVFVINLNNELSFTTSCNKAIRLALKILNANTNLNQNSYEEIGIPLNLTVSIIKKDAENLLKYTPLKNNIKNIALNKKCNNFSKGFQLIIDQHVRDTIYKDYKTDSLYSFEKNGINTSFYEVVLASYINPPSKNQETDIKIIKKDLAKKQKITNNDLYSFNVFDINAKCTFKKCSTSEIIQNLNSIDLNKEGKVISLKSNQENSYLTSNIVNFYKEKGFKTLSINCSEKLTYKTWGAFSLLFKENFELPLFTKNIDFSHIEEKIQNKYKKLFDFILEKPLSSKTSEDARFTYIDLWCKFLTTLNNTVIIIENFENIDDTSLQTLELFFDKIKKMKLNFMFISTKEESIHNKIKKLLRTNLYTEIYLQPSSIEQCLESFKSDAGDFIKSIYFKELTANFNDSYLYFRNTLDYLKELNILIKNNNKFAVKNKKAITLPNSLYELNQARIANISKNENIRLILEYLSILGPKLDIKILEKLIEQNISDDIKILINSNLIYFENGIINLNNADVIIPIIRDFQSNDNITLFIKQIIAKIGNDLNNIDMAFLMGRLQLFKEEYLILWKNAQFAIKTGDFDVYLNNCLGFLSLIEHTQISIPEEKLKKNKLNVYNNIMKHLYNYSQSKIYFIEKILLADAIEKHDEDRIIRLSNQMLQGALLNSNYTDAMELFDNIISRMKNPSLIVEGEINVKYLLLTLVKIEILFNIGNYRECIELAHEIITFLNQDNINEIKPANFNINQFIIHLQETFRLVGIAKVLLLENDLEEYFDQIQQALGMDLLDKDCILAIKDFLEGNIYSTGNIEEYSAYSKIIFLILQEFSILKNNYKRFAQNIYQAKLLANEIAQCEIEYFCDLLIGYAYLQIGINKKAESILYDIKNKAEASTLSSIMILANYFIAQLQYSEGLVDEAINTIQTSLNYIRKHSSQAKVFIALFKNIYYTIAKQEDLDLENFDEDLLANLKEKLPTLL